jgi:hypothetical protein
MDILNFLNTYLPFFGLILYGYSAVYAPNIIRFNSDFFIKAIKFILTISIVRIIIFSIFFKQYLIDVSDLLSDIIQPSDLMRVGYEDAVYVLPFILARNYLSSKFSEKTTNFIVIPFFIFSSLWFGMGHLYQGPVGMLAAIMPTISWYYSARYGLSSMMLVHVCYDSIAYITIMIGAFFL